MEKFVNGDGHVVADTHHGTEGVGTQTHVGMLTHIFKALAFLLHRIVGWASTEQFNFLGLNLNVLTGTDTLNELTVHTQTCACGDLLQHLFVKLGHVSHNLNVVDG